MRFTFSLFLLLLSSYSFAESIQKRDLAIILDDAFSKPITVAEKLGDKPLLSTDWYKQILTAYENSPIGTALEEENSYKEWQLVSMRVVPCKPMVRSTFHSPSTFCFQKLD